MFEGLSDAGHVATFLPKIMANYFSSDLLPLRRNPNTRSLWVLEVAYSTLGNNALTMYQATWKRAFAQSLEQERDL